MRVLGSGAWSCGVCCVFLLVSGARSSIVWCVFFLVSGARSCGGHISHIYHSYRWVLHGHEVVGVVRSWRVWWCAVM